MFSKKIYTWIEFDKIECWKGLKIEVTDIVSNTTTVYASVRQAAKALNCKHDTAPWKTNFEEGYKQTL